MSIRRVLVVRAEPAACRTAARLRAAGFEPVVLPMSRTVVDDGGVGAVVAGGWSAIAVTSANAVAALAGAGDGEKARALFGLPLFAVGPETAAAASRAGFSDVRPGPGSGSGLVPLIAAAFDGARAAAATAPARHRLVYVAGLPRSAGFEAGLRAHGIPHETIVCYRTVDAELSDDAIRRVVSSDGIDAVLLYSQAQARRLFARAAPAGLSAALSSAVLVCLSDAVAEGLPPGPRQRAVVAGEAREESLIARLGGLGR